MRIRDRNAWGAKYANGHGTRPLSGVREIWLHHEAGAVTSPGMTVAQEAARMRHLEHVGQQRFRQGISYPWVVFPSGRIWQGLTPDAVGAHTGGRNSTSTAISWPGNYEQQHGTSAQREATSWLLAHIRRQGWATVHQFTGGHRDVPGPFGNTLCPGRFAYQHIGSMNTRAQNLYAGERAPEPPTGATYVVQPGDTLGELARRLGTSVQGLVILNGISDPDVIRAGQRLWIRWVVSPGQTLGAISSRLRSAGLPAATVERLAELNGLPDPDVIRAGQNLRIP